MTTAEAEIPGGVYIPGQHPRAGSGPHDEAPEAGTPVPSDPPLTRILPPKGWQPVNVRELWQFRELLYFLTWRDVKVRYKQTLLGAAWAVLQPAMMMVVFTVFFAKLARVPAGDMPYPLFVYMGLLPWTFFATAITNAGNSVVGSERLVSKIYFPRLAIPFASVGAAVVDFLIAFGLLVALMLFYGLTPNVQMLMVLPTFLVIVLLAAGVGTLLAALNVAYRDFRYVIPFMVQVWLFATPTIYMAPDTTGGGWIKSLMALNPMTGLVAAFRAACCGTALPWAQLGVSAALAVLTFLAACFYFRRREQSFADVI